MFPFPYKGCAIQIFLGSFLTVVLVPQSTFGTMIVGIRLPDQIVLAVDSRRIFDTKAGPRLESVCKMFRVDNVFFALAGLTGEEKSGFGVQEIIEHAFNANESLDTKMEKAEEETKKEWGKILIELARRGRVDRKRPQILSVVAATIDNGVPLLMFREFTAHVQLHYVSFEVERYRCPGTCKKDTTVRLFGTHTAIDDSITVNLSFLLRTSPEVYASKLIEIQSTHSDKVAPPVDTVRLTPLAAPMWMLKPGCRL